jgi:hypothetical protein
VHRRPTERVAFFVGEAAPTVRKHATGHQARTWGHHEGSGAATSGCTHAAGAQVAAVQLRCAQAGLQVAQLVLGPGQVALQRLDSALGSRGSGHLPNPHRHAHTHTHTHPHIHIQHIRHTPLTPTHP